MKILWLVPLLALIFLPSAFAAGDVTHDVAVYAVAFDDQGAKLDRLWWGNMNDFPTQIRFDVTVQNYGNQPEQNVWVWIYQYYMYLDDTGLQVFDYQLLSTKVADSIDSLSSQSYTIILPTDRLQPLPCHVKGISGWTLMYIDVYATYNNYTIDTNKCNNKYSVPVKVKPLCKKI